MVIFFSLSVLLLRSLVFWPGFKFILIPTVSRKQATDRYIGGKRGSLNFRH